MILAIRFRVALLTIGLLCFGCGGGSEVAGYPDVDLGVPVEVYKQTAERDLHLHVFRPVDGAPAPVGAVLFFHGGGFASTRVPQFEHQARALARAGTIGIIVEYRVTAEGTSRAEAIVDGLNATEFVRSNADRLGVDPLRIALAGSSAGGALATEASASADALVLFNPAVRITSAPFVSGQPTIAFHSRADTIVPFAAVDSFCERVANCEMVAFDEGDHGFFNEEPALTETTAKMIEFLQAEGW